jgi:putative NADH-flavin reductase
MHITVFGAGGAIGKLLVAKALHEGHFVTAYARNALKFGISHENLTFVQGEMYDYEKIQKAISGADSIICTLGPPVKRNYNGFLVLDGHRNIIKAMKAENVRRLITIATPSVKFERDVSSLATRLPGLMARLFLPQAYKEIVQIGRIVSECDLDWTIVRVISPNNNQAKGRVKVTFGDAKITFGISREDIADFLLKQTIDEKYIHSMPIIGN